MSRRIVIIAAVIVVAGFLVVGGVAAYVLRPPATPSGAIVALTLEPTVTQAALATATGEAPLAASSDFITAELVQTESQARFIINEILNGAPNAVVGVTDQVAAQIIIDPTNPANVQMGPVTVNARTLVTDSNNRNRAIQNVVLETGTYEFLTFTPTSFVGLPATGAVGDTFVFQIVGDLTIRDVTHEVTFDVTVSVESATRLSGLATATILRNDYDLNIPDVPFVASVDPDLIIEIEFVAEKQ